MYICIHLTGARWGTFTGQSDLVGQWHVVAADYTNFALITRFLSTTKHFHQETTIADVEVLLVKIG